MHMHIQPSAYQEPSIIEQEGRMVTSMTAASRLLKNRIIMFSGVVFDEMANSIMAQLLYLNSLSDEPIHLYINSPGGSISAGLAVYDTMNLIKAPVYTTVIGQAASMGAFILSAGAKGHRYATRNSSIMIHEPRLNGGGITGTNTDIQIDAEHLKYTTKLMNKILAKNCGKTYEEMVQICSRDKWFYETEDAKAFGIIDQIIDKQH